jgi:hypothetical protein
MIWFWASSGCKAPWNGQIPVSTHKFYMLPFSKTLFEEIAA